jgi:hypothetical protein
MRITKVDESELIDELVDNVYWKENYRLLNNFILQYNNIISHIREREEK